MVFSGALHGSVGMDLQMEAGPAVKLPPPQNPFQMAEVRQASGQPLRGHQVLLLLPLSSHHQSRQGVVVHSPGWGENKLGANGSWSGTEAVQKADIDRCPHHR